VAIYEIGIRKINRRADTQKHHTHAAIKSRPYVLVPLAVGAVGPTGVRPTGMGETWDEKLTSDSL